MNPDQKKPHWKHKPSGKKSKNPPRLRKKPDEHNVSTLDTLSGQVGESVVLETKNGESHTGIIKSLSTKVQLVLQTAHSYNNAEGQCETIIVDLKEILEVQTGDLGSDRVTQPDAADSAVPPNPGSLLNELVAWEPEPDITLKRLDQTSVWNVYNVRSNRPDPLLDPDRGLTLSTSERENLVRARKDLSVALYGRLCAVIENMPGPWSFYPPEPNYEDQDEPVVGKTARRRPLKKKPDPSESAENSQIEASEGFKPPTESPLCAQEPSNEVYKNAPYALGNLKPQKRSYKAVLCNEPLVFEVPSAPEKQETCDPKDKMYPFPYIRARTVSDLKLLLDPQPSSSSSTDKATSDTFFGKMVFERTKSVYDQDTDCDESQNTWKEKNTDESQLINTCITDNTQPEVTLTVEKKEEQKVNESGVKMHDINENRVDNDFDEIKLESSDVQSDGSNSKGVWPTQHSPEVVSRNSPIRFTSDVDQCLSETVQEKKGETDLIIFEEEENERPLQTGQKNNGDADFISDVPHCSSGIVKKCGEKVDFISGNDPQDPAEKVQDWAEEIDFNSDNDSQRPAETVQEWAEEVDFISDNDSQPPLETVEEWADETDFISDNVAQGPAETAQESEKTDFVSDVTQCPSETTQDSEKTDFVSDVAQSPSETASGNGNKALILDDAVQCSLERKTDNTGKDSDLSPDVQVAKSLTVEKGTKDASNIPPGNLTCSSDAAENAKDVTQKLKKESDRNPAGMSAKEHELTPGEHSTDTYETDDQNDYDNNSESFSNDQYEPNYKPSPGVPMWQYHLPQYFLLVDPFTGVTCNVPNQYVAQFFVPPFYQLTMLPQAKQYQLNVTQPQFTYNPSPQYFLNYQPYQDPNVQQASDPVPSYAPYSPNIVHQNPVPLQAHFQPLTPAHQLPQPPSFQVPNYPPPVHRNQHHNDVRNNLPPNTRSRRNRPMHRH